MLKRKHLVLGFFVSCLAITLLIGATSSSAPYDAWHDVNDDGIIDLFDVVALAARFGTTGTPINKTAVLLDLQDRVNSIEERLDQTKTIRFFEPSETFTEFYNVWVEATRFIWIPQNKTNNAILSIFCYFEYKSEMVDMVDLRVRILCNNNRTGELTFVNHPSWTQSPVWVVPCMYESGELEGFSANAESHTLVFEISSQDAQYPEMYVTNINIVITVADGLPASNG